MTPPSQGPVVLRLTGPRLLLVGLALAGVVALALWAGYRLGGESRGPGPDRGAPPAADAPMEEGTVAETDGFEEPVVIGSGYAVIAFSGASLGEAEAQRARLAERGLPVRLDQDPRRPSAERFRLLVGPFSEKADAESARRSLQEGGDRTLEVVWIE